MTKYFDIIADYDKKIQSLIYNKEKESVGECSRYSMSEENVQKFLKNSLKKGIEIDSYKEREIKKHAKQIQRISAQRVKKFHDNLQVKEILNRFSVILNEVKNKEFDVRLGIFIIMCNYLYILKAQEKVNEFKNIIYEKLILVYFKKELHITECIFNYLWILYTSQLNRSNVPFKEEEKHIKNLYECYRSEKTQVIGLYLLAYEFKAYSNDIGEDIYNNRFKNMCEYKDSLDKIIKIVRGLDGDFLEFFFSEGHRYQMEVKNHNFKVDQRPPLPYVFFTSAADKLVELLPNNYISNLDNTRAFLVEQIIDKREILSDENIDGLLYLVRNMRLFLKKKESVDCVVKYKADSFREKVQSPLVIYRTYASFLIFQILNRVIEEYQEVISLNEELKRQSDDLEKTNIKLERVNQELKYANKSKGDLINEFNHKYKNMQYDNLKELTNTLLTHPLKEVREQGRKAAIELFIKRTLRMDVILLMLKYEAVENSDNNEFLNKFKRGIKEESTDNNLSIENIFYNCFNLVFMRFLYNGKKYYDMKNPVPREEYCVYKDLSRHIEVSTGKSMEDFMLDFDNLVLDKNENIIEFLRKYNIVITTDLDWGNIFFDEGDYAEVLLNDMIIELITNIFKYADFNCEIIFSMDKRVNEKTEKMCYCIRTVNACRVLKKSKGKGIESIQSVLDLLKKEEDDVGDRIGRMEDDNRWMSFFYIDENIFV